MNTYLKDLVERVAGAFAVGSLSVLGADAFNILNVDWRATLGVGGGAALLSLLKGVAARFRGDPDNASLRRG